MTTPARRPGRHRAGNATAGNAAVGNAIAGGGDPADGDPRGSDTALLAAVRAGESTAYGELYARHCGAARRLARVLVRDPSDADDLVAEAFAKVLAALRAGKGPEVAFRAYLLTAVRHACYDRARRDRRIELTEDITRYETPETADPTLARLERSYAARAFAKLPERWRMVLWHTEVEGEKPASIAPLLGLTPNAVAALAYRARERLRQMYLQEHIDITSDPTCHWTADRLGAHVRHALPRRDSSKVDAHLATCRDCQALRAELAEVNSGLRGVLAPVVLGGAATPYLGTTAAGPGLVAGWWTAVTGWWAGLAGWCAGLATAVVAWLSQQWTTLVRTARALWGAVADRVRELVQRYGAGNVAAGAGVAAATLVGVVLFAVAVIVDPLGDPPDSDRPPAAAPGVPVPAPGPLPPPVPQPTGEPDPSPAGTPAPSAGPRSARQPAPGDPPAPPAGSPAPAGGPPASAPSDPILAAPDYGGTTLTAGGTGELAIEVRLPAAEAVPAADALVPEIHQVAQAGEVVLVLGWPVGMTLAGDDASDGWQCRTGTTSQPGDQLDRQPVRQPAGATCRRPAWPAGQARTARVPVTVDPALGGLIPIEVAVTAGDGRSGRWDLRVPAAPAGMRVGYAATGPYRLAVAGNTWLSCPDRPTCLQGDEVDNNFLALVGYLPGPGEPAPPPGLALDAASGATLAVPGGAEVVWAGLWWATTAATGPDPVALHHPGTGWQALTPDAVHRGAGRPLWQAYAEVTDLVRGAATGPWWLAAAATDLPTGSTASAGWSLTVLYADPGAPARDVAVFAGPVSLHSGTSLAVGTAAEAGAAVEAGLVAWEGDRLLSGGQLRLGGAPLGDPENVTASRAAGALECPDGGYGCDWHTFGVDVGLYHGTGGPLTLTTGADLFEVGVLAVAADPPR